MMSIPLVIWVNSPPYVEAGPFSYLEDSWGGEVIYAILSDLRPERKAMGWAEAWQRPNVRRSEGVGLKQFVEDVLGEFDNAIHLVAGMSSVTGKALSVITKRVPPRRVAVYSERPGSYGPLHRRVVKKALLPIKYSILARKYRDKVGLLLPLGMSGLVAFKRFGWHLEGDASFMYCPIVPESQVAPTATPRSFGTSVKFLYVGRMSKYAKGTDILVKAVDRLRGDWSLTLVGGHGDFVDEIRSWTMNRKNVAMTGAASPEEVRRLILDHDVCVVPSRVDGWNVVVNEALSMGRGVIVTDNVGSDELVKHSGAGLVVRRGSVRDLAAAMQFVIDEPSVSAIWASKAKKYAKFISPESVGQYLGQLLTSMSQGQDDTAEYPPPPWLSCEAHFSQTG